VTVASSPSFRAALEGLELIDTPVLLRQRSRDFYWYSPILKRQLDGKAADLIAVPHSIDDVIRVAAACARFAVPLVVRGGATGNYGQMVPLQGGVLLDMAKLDRTVSIAGDRARFEAGVKLIDADLQVPKDRLGAAHVPLDAAAGDRRWLRQRRRGRRGLDPLWATARSGGRCWP